MLLFRIVQVDKYKKKLLDQRELAFFWSTFKAGVSGVVFLTAAVVTVPLVPSVLKHWLLSSYLQCLLGI